MTPGDIGTLTEEMQSLGTSDYMGAQTWESMMQKNKGDDEEDFRFPLTVRDHRPGGPLKTPRTLVLTVCPCDIFLAQLKRRASGSTSGFATPGANGSSSLSQGDLDAADAALAQRKLPSDVSCPAQRSDPKDDIPQTTAIS